MKVCLVSSYPPNHARMSEYAKCLATELAKRPTISNLTVIADQIINLKSNLTEESKIKILRIWREDNLISILLIMFNLLKLKPDIVHFSIGYQSYGKSRIANFAGLSLVFLCRLFRLKVVVLLHNLADLIDLEKVKQKPSFVNKIGIHTATRLILSASRVVVMVKSYSDYLKKHYNTKGVLYSPHGSMSGEYVEIDSPGKTILMFGHMGPFKGLPIMLSAFEKIVKERSDIKLVIAGTDHPNFPGYLNEFITKAPSKVYFIGYVPEEDLHRVFGVADVVVTPYLLATGTSGVFHLACGFGRPVVSSDLAEMRELVADGASALLVPPNDAEALKIAILKILDNKKEAMKMGEKNLKFASKEQWSTIAQFYEKTYLELLKT